MARRKRPYTLREATTYLDLSPLWVRRMVKKGIIKAEKVDGKWMLDATSVEDKKKALKEKYKKQELRRQGLLQREYLPPSLKSVQMIRRKVIADEGLTNEERNLFLERLDRYEAEYQADLEARRAKVAANKEPKE